MRLFIPVLIVSFLAACVPQRGLNRKAFAPSEAGSKIVFRVPAGYEEEQLNLDSTGGKAQYYTYPYGALYYIYYHAHEASGTMPAEGGVRAALSGSEPAWEGVDERGFYWKEVVRGRYRFGYRYVPVNMVAQFDRALHSVRIKKGGL